MLFENEFPAKLTFLDWGGFFFDCENLLLLLDIQLHLIDLLLPDFPEPDGALLITQHPVWLHSDTETFVEPAKCKTSNILFSIQVFSPVNLLLVRISVLNGLLISRKE